MSAPGYVVSNGMAGTPQALTTTFITITRLVNAGSAAKRFYIWEIDVSQNAAPNSTDCAVEYSLAYCSAAGAGTKTTLVANPLGGGFVAGANLDLAVTLGAGNYTAEPTTYTQAYEFWHKAVNQRGSALWQAAPGGELWQPSTVSVGPGLRALSTNYTGTSLAVMRFTEI